MYVFFFMKVGLFSFLNDHIDPPPPIDKYRSILNWLNIFSLSPFERMSFYGCSRIYT